MTHPTLEAPLGSLSTQPAQDHVTTGTEPDTGRLLLTQQTWLPRLSTRLDCSGSELPLNCEHSQVMRLHETDHGMQTVCIPSRIP